MHLPKNYKLTVKNSLKEDIRKEDITTRLVIPKHLKGSAVIVPREKGILCGVSIAREVFYQVDKSLAFYSFKKEGSAFNKGEKVVKISGKMRSIITAERVALNFLSFLSGISTTTRQFVDKISLIKTKIMDTRKTTPTLRAFEKYAVRVGGGYNHRSSLSDAILVKDNHLHTAKYFGDKKIDKEKFKKFILLARKKTSLKIEVETETLSEFRQIIHYRPDVIMLDNFSLKGILTAVKLRNEYFPTVLLEASGGINLNNVLSVAKTGVDFISVGKLTHSPRAIDFSLEIS